MKGLTVKEILRENRYVLRDIAQKMGETPQNLNSILKTDDIRTSVVERIAEAIGQPVSFFYGDTNIATASGENSTAVAGNGNNINAQADKFLLEITAQRKMTEKMMDRSQDQIDRLLGIIENFKEEK